MYTCCVERINYDEFFESKPAVLTSASHLPSVLFGSRRSVNLSKVWQEYFNGQTPDTMSHLRMMSLSFNPLNVDVSLKTTNMTKTFQNAAA